MVGRAGSPALVTEISAGHNRDIVAHVTRDRPRSRAGIPDVMAMKRNVFR